MDNEKINSTEFLKEIQKLPAKCKGVTAHQARNKAKNLYYKFSDLIVYSDEYFETRRKENQELQNIISALKSGVIFYAGGFTKLSDIQSMHTLEDGRIKIINRDKTEHIFVKEFAWIKNIF